MSNICQQISLFDTPIQEEVNNNIVQNSNNESKNKILDTKKVSDKKEFLDVEVGDYVLADNIKENIKGFVTRRYGASNETINIVFECEDGKKGVIPMYMGNVLEIIKKANK